MVILRGDAEQSLQAMLMEVSNSASNVKVIVQSSVPGLRQSIGAAERAHAHAGAQLWALLGTLSMKYGVEQPTDRLFSWALRHSAVLLNAYSKMEAKLTPFGGIREGEVGGIGGVRRDRSDERSNNLVKGKTAMRWIMGSGSASSPTTVAPWCWPTPG